MGDIRVPTLRPQPFGAHTSRSGTPKWFAVFVDAGPYGSHGRLRGPTSGNLGHLCECLLGASPKRHRSFPRRLPSRPIIRSFEVQPQAADRPSRMPRASRRHPAKRCARLKFSTSWECAALFIPAEAPLTVFVGMIARLVTLMTLGASPGALGAGVYAQSAADQGRCGSRSISVDWRRASQSSRPLRERATPSVLLESVAGGSGQGRFTPQCCPQLDTYRLPEPARRASVGARYAACWTSCASTTTIHRHADRC